MCESIVCISNVGFWRGLIFEAVIGILVGIFQGFRIACSPCALTEMTEYVRENNTDSDDHMRRRGLKFIEVAEREDGLIKRAEGFLL